MSEKTIFGDNGMGFQNNLDTEVTDAYISVRNLSNQTDDSDWKDFLKDVAYGVENGDVCLGEVQNEADTPKVKNFKAGSSSYPTEIRDGEIVPEGVPTNPDNKSEAATSLQMMNGMSFGTTNNEEAPLTGNSSPDTEDDNENESNESPDTDMESEFDELVENVSGMGEETVKNFRSYVATNDWSAPEEIDMEVTAGDRYDSVAEVPSDELADMSKDQISEIRG